MTTSGPTLNCVAVRQSGLTILELVVGTCLATVLAGAALMGFRDLERRWRLESGVRQLVLDLRLARIGAIAEGRPHRLRFEEDSGIYHAEWRHPSGGYAAALGPRQLPRGVQVSECTARGDAVSFQPRGNAGTFGTIALSGPDAQSRRIIVDIAGRVRVQ